MSTSRTAAPFVAQLALAGRAVLVVGAGAAALPQVAALLAAEADVTVRASQALPSIADLADRGLLRWIRPSSPQEADGHDSEPVLTTEIASGAPGGGAYWLVVAASGNTATDQRIAAAATGARVISVASAALADAGDAVGAQPGTRKAGAGRVILVGGGPGDPGLITVAGLAAVAAADVIVTDRLAPLAVLAHARAGAQVIDVAKIPRGRSTSQEEINRLLVEHALAGNVVVRFKGGDSFVFGRGAEEVEACAAAGIPVQVIPGVTAAVAAPELAGIPVTHRGLNQGFTVISGHVPPGDPRSTLDYQALAHTGTDLVLLMAVATLPAITAALIDAGLAPDTPAAVVADAGLASQRDVRGTVASIAGLAEKAQVRSPAVTVIGAVAAIGAAAAHS